MFNGYGISVVVLMSMVVAGCASLAGPTPEQIAAAQDAECRSYGAKPGTDAYVDCRMRLVQMEQQRRTALATAIISRPRPEPYMVVVPTPAPITTTPRINCTSRTIGSTVYTDCN